MTPLQTPPNDDACYLAVKARDARFGGGFFTGVTCTRIYCRRVRTPRRENCRFFAYAAQAEQAVRQVATLSGFASVRRFNAAFVQAYGLNPTGLRLSGSLRAVVLGERCGPAKGAGRQARQTPRQRSRGGLAGLAPVAQLCGHSGLGSGPGRTDPNPTDCYLIHSSKPI